MGNIKLDTLLQAFHNAVLEAQLLTEQQHIEQLNRYFDWPDIEQLDQAGADLDAHILKNGGKAKTWKVEVPSLRPDAKPNETDTITVPLMSLIPPTAIKIKSMIVEFSVGLNEIAINDNSNKESFTGKNKQAIPESSIGVDLSIPSDKIFGKRASKAKIKIEFESGEPSESFLRINDHLIKSIV